MVNFLPSTDSCGIYYSPKYQTGIRFLMEPKEKKQNNVNLAILKRDTKTEKNSRSNLSSPAAENFLSQLLIGVLCEKSSHSREILLNVEGSIVKKTMAPLCSQITGKYHMFLSVTKSGQLLSIIRSMQCVFKGQHTLKHFVS